MRQDPEGLVFLGRMDEQVKLGGRRIELGEIDAALQSLPGVSGAAAAVKTTAAGNQILVGYLAADPGFDTAAARERLAGMLPAPLIPLLAVVDTLPTKTSGKVDRHALPWPLAGASRHRRGSCRSSARTPGGSSSSGPACWEWRSSPWTPTSSPPAAVRSRAAQLVSALRVRHRTVAVADIYSHPRIGSLIEALGAGSDEPVEARTVERTTRKAQVFQTLMGIPTFILVGMRWLVYLAAGNNVLGALGVFTDAPTALLVGGGRALAGLRVLPGAHGDFRRRGPDAAAQPGARDYPRSGKVHLRLWMAQQIADLADPVSLASAHWIQLYARALGAKVGSDVQLHSIPPVTGLLTVGRGANIEPEVDLTGYWIDGDRRPRRRHRGRRRGERRGAQHPDARLRGRRRRGAGAGLRPGRKHRGVLRLSGSPATRTGKAKPDWPREPVSAAGRGAAHCSPSPPRRSAPSRCSRSWAPCAWRPCCCAARNPCTDPWAGSRWSVPLARSSGSGSTCCWCSRPPGCWALACARAAHRVDSRIGWQVWATERLLDMARDLLFPLYASSSRPCGCACSAPRSGATSRPPRCC